MQHQGVLSWQLPVRLVRGAPWQGDPRHDALPAAPLNLDRNRRTRARFGTEPDKGLGLRPLRVVSPSAVGAALHGREV